jgi:hypothetical protein
VELERYMTELEAFKANQGRQRRHSSVFSTTSTSLDSQGSIWSRVSTAPTQWSCDSCGDILGWKSNQVAEIVMAFHRIQQVAGDQ